MAQIFEVPEEAVESSTSSASTSSNQVSIIPVTFDSSAFDSLTVDLYNALSLKTKAEKLNLDLPDQLCQCHMKIKELTIFEENLKYQVFVNQLLCVEREQVVVEREKALAELKA